MKRLIKDHPLSCVFFALFVLFTAGSLLSTVPDEGWKKWFQDWTNNGSTEMLQLFLIVWLTQWVPDKGSKEAKDPEEVEGEK